MKNVKLLRTKKYTYGPTGKTYVLGKTYLEKDDVAEELLDKEDGAGLPYFMLSKDDSDEVLKEAELESINQKAESENKAQKKTKGKTQGKNTSAPESEEGESSEDSGAVSV